MPVQTTPQTHWLDDFIWALNHGTGAHPGQITGHAPPQTGTDWVTAIMLLVLVGLLWVTLWRKIQGEWPRRFLAWLEERGKNPVP